MSKEEEFSFLHCTFLANPLHFLRSPLLENEKKGKEREKEKGLPKKMEKWIGSKRKRERKE